VQHFIPKNAGVIVNVSSVHGEKPVLGLAYSTRPIDQAYAALYLASDMSRAVTGHILQVDNGGWL